MEVVKGPDGVREETLTRLMAQYGNDLMRMSAAFLRDHALAEDAVQETFVKAYQSMAAFRGDSAEKTWLMRIAINTCRSIRRDKWFRFVERGVTPEDLPAQAASGMDSALTEAVMSLPYKHREVVLLYYYQGMSLQEISEALGVAVSTVSTRLKKAREGLRRDIKGGQAHV